MFLGLIFIKNERAYITQVL